ncbi:hypothetical protein LMG23992_02550 [Cupriavidus laharis]|uniref:Uncharacterized protein n=1 Tax=Cupriavidus laharis TaxID=151654 RepID=A0ABM8X1R7_9BURK|nr:hypothetical protein LMG23992_02550 [Cupriavidus laharis]
MNGPDRQRRRGPHDTVPDKAHRMRLLRGLFRKAASGSDSGGLRPRQAALTRAQRVTFTPALPPEHRRVCLAPYTPSAPLRAPRGGLGALCGPERLQGPCRASADLLIVRLPLLGDEYALSCMPAIRIFQLRSPAFAGRMMTRSGNRHVRRIRRRSAYTAQPGFTFAGMASLHSGHRQKRTTGFTSFFSCIQIVVVGKRRAVLWISR